MTDVRRHGLEWPLSAHQIGAVIGVAYTIASFILVLRPTVVDHIVFFSVFAFGLTSFLVTVLIDPRVIPEQAPTDGNRFCNSCEMSMSPRTKHCRICNKCIYRFDHHCLYLNTCIGGRNYRPFFTLVTLTVSWLSMYLAVAVITFVDKVENSNAHDDIYGSTVIYLSVLGCISLVPLLMFIAVLSLWMFHIYIGFLRVSTYDWIIGKRSSDAPIEMPVQQSERRQDEIQARRQEIYEQWVRQNRLRQKQQQNLEMQQQQQQQQQQQHQPQQQQPQQQSNDADIKAVNRSEAVLDVLVPDVKIDVADNQLARTNSESILSQVEEVLGIDIKVNEGQLRPDQARPDLNKPSHFSLSQLEGSISSSNQDAVR